MCMVIACVDDTKTIEEEVRIEIGTGMGASRCAHGTRHRRGRQSQTVGFGGE